MAEITKQRRIRGNQKLLIPYDVATTTWVARSSRIHGVCEGKEGAEAMNTRNTMNTHTQQEDKGTVALTGGQPIQPVSLKSGSTRRYPNSQSDGIRTPRRGLETLPTITPARPLYNSKIDGSKRGLGDRVPL
jgi:hypothetical protein